MNAPARPAVAAVEVVVPAHQEGARLGACLASVTAALADARRRRPGPAYGVVVVLDRCTDASARIAAADPGVVALPVEAGCAGVARALGVADVADRHRGLDPATVLVLNTDADCVVPEGWVVDHVDLARDHDVVQGSVAPMPHELSEVALALWWERNPADRASLHGANLGFRLDAYLAAGGYPALAVREDVALVAAMKARGAAAVAGTRVLTSARRTGRTGGGFAAYLRDLDVELGDQSAPPGSGRSSSPAQTSTSTSRSE